ncbi:MAG TPA: tetratricopeptide repeat protein [Blastocatellia bacterium]|nr:tetratricopeptide repeat protein [Blastocatellia bacterium]
MQKHNLLFGLVGIVIGVAVGYFVTQSINNAATNTPAAAASQAPAGMPQEVLAMIKKANDEPGNFEAQMQVAMLYRQIGRSEKEIEFLQRAAKLKPTDATVLQSLTEAFLEAGNKTEAANTLKLLEKAQPKHPSIAELKKRLDAK